MQKVLSSDYKLQFLSDFLESAITYFSYDDEITNRIDDLRKYIEQIRYSDDVNINGMSLVSESYIEVYE